MMLRTSSTEAAAVLSEMSDGPPKCRPSAVFPWHFPGKLGQRREAAATFADFRGPGGNKFAEADFQFCGQFHQADYKGST
jgi:hypothetical protein